MLSPPVFSLLVGCAGSRDAWSLSVCTGLYSSVPGSFLSVLQMQEYRLVRRQHALRYQAGDQSGYHFRTAFVDWAGTEHWHFRLWRFRLRRRQQNCWMFATHITHQSSCIATRTGKINAAVLALCFILADFFQYVSKRPNATTYQREMHLQNVILKLLHAWWQRFYKDDLLIYEDWTRKTAMRLWWIESRQTSGLAFIDGFSVCRICEVQLVIISLAVNELIWSKNRENEVDRCTLCSWPALFFFVVNGMRESRLLKRMAAQWK